MQLCSTASRRSNIDCDRFTYTPILNQRLAGLTDQSRKTILFVLTISTAGNNYSRQTGCEKDDSDDHPVAEHSTDTCFQESSQFVKITAGLDKADFGNEIGRVDQFFKRHVLQLELTDD